MSKERNIVFLAYWFRFPLEKKSMGMEKKNMIDFTPKRFETSGNFFSPEAQDTAVVAAAHILVEFSTHSYKVR